MPIDRFGRNINYLRVALTDLCNLRCVYCMPEDMVFRPREELLQDGELVRLVKLFAASGFEKFRLTGGEPTLRENLVSLVQSFSSIDGVRQLAMTTNAVTLKHLARPLKDAGLDRINISMDTLEPEKFKKLTRWGHIDDVWKGIEAAQKAGLEVKINSVTVRGFNDGKDAVDLARLTLEHDLQVRYIEMMPFGKVSDFQKSGVVTEDELRTRIESELGPMTLLNDGELDGEARMFRLENGKGMLGFISSVTNPFCEGCNRARLTADGKLRLCLLRDKEVDLLTPLRKGATDEELLNMISNGIWDKPWGHGLAQQVHPISRVMSEIGG